MQVNILDVGDLCGQNGLDFFCRRLRQLQKQNNIRFTVVNGENASVSGFTVQQAEDMLDAGADVITLGNHTFGKYGVSDYLDDCPRILRPGNLAPQNPGRGWGEYETDFGTVCVMNLIGRCGMSFGPDNPFFAADRILEKKTAPITLLDFHAEATSEKLAMAYYLDGRITAMWGTHTHVQTNDPTVFPGGTGYLTDLGMTGPADSVLGIVPRQSVSLFLNNPPQRYESASGPCKLEGAVYTIDTGTGRCVSVVPLRETERRYDVG